MVLILTYWRIDGYDSEDLLFSRLCLYFGLFLWALAGGYMIFSLGQEHKRMQNRNEEQKIILPVIKKIRKLGISISGPLSPDSAFQQKNLRFFDAFICMYHDQALIPVKTIDFENTINYTLGLSFIRTSPDHGTGYDIANKFIANETSLITAINYAAKI